MLCVVWCIYSRTAVRILGGRGGGAHMGMHKSSVLVAMSVCAMHPRGNCDNSFFIFYLFYQFDAETICVLGENHSRLEHLD